jgi:hypothetical protein
LQNLSIEGSEQLQLVNALLSSFRELVARCSDRGGRFNDEHLEQAKCSAFTSWIHDA